MTVDGTRRADVRQGRGSADAGVVGARLLLSAGAGVALFLSFPPRSTWFLAPLALAAIGYVLTERRSERNGRALSKKGGFLYGSLFGLGFLLPLLPWVGTYVGPVPWIALAVVEALFFGLFGVLAVMVSRLPWAVLWLTAAWSLTEWLRSSVPFGGFPWGKLAFGQSESPLLPLASVGGAPLLGAVVAAVGIGVALGVRFISARRWTALVGVTAVVAAGPVGALALSPTLAGPTDGNSTVTIAAIQGSVPRLGLDFNAQRRQVLENHVNETLRLADDVDAGRAPRPDVVIWPENASDVDPTRDPVAADDITAASVRIGAPILVGAVLANQDGTSTNSVIAWDGTAGPGERHDKKIIQPFGEYMPYRSFFRLFSSLADSAGNFVPGDGDGVVRVEVPEPRTDPDASAGAAPTTDEIALAIGVATCYEVAFDRAPTEAVRAGAEVLAVPTNNATFGDTEMTYQQLAMSRVRAVEHSRSVIVAATSGVSAIIAPDGSVTSQTALFEPDYLVSTIGLRTDTTLATRYGAALEWVLVGLGAAGVLAALVSGRRADR